MKKLVLFNGTSCLELPPQVLPSRLPQSHLPQQSNILSKLTPDTPVVKQLTLLPNETSETEEGLSTLLLESEPQYYSTHGVVPLRISPSPCAHIQITGSDADLTIITGTITTDATTSTSTGTTTKTDKNTGKTAATGTLTILSGSDTYLNGRKLSCCEFSLFFCHIFWAGAKRFILHP